MNASEFVSRLDRVKQTSRISWTARCPAHDDRGPSLSVRDADGKILLHCFAGCEPLAVVESVGLSLADLFPEPLEHSKSMRRPFPAADVLECLSEESKIVHIVADRIVKGLPVAETDMTRMRVAVSRIEAAREVANG